MTNAKSTQGAFNYLDNSVRHSLYRNGEVFTRRNPDGSDGPFEGATLAEQTMTVRSARHVDGPQRSLMDNGFELHTKPLADPGLDFFQHKPVVTEYYPQCERLVKDATGAALVVAFDHNVRSAAGKQSQQRIAGGQEVQGPAHLVHGDYTLTSAPQRLLDLTNPPGANDTVRSLLGPGETLLNADTVADAIAGGRFAIVNVWRNIVDEPVATHPLALCDAQTVHPDDLVVFEIHYHDRIGENYFAKHSPRHQWYYYPGMTRDEALLLKQWDSAGTLAQSKGARADASTSSTPCTFSFHSAFDDPATPSDAPERWSIEVRCAVLY